MENKLSKYNGYVPKSLESWKRQFDMDSECKDKILENLLILNSREIRDLIRSIVQEHKKLLDSDDSFICRFGPTAKSGDVVLYEFSHTFKGYAKKIKELWEIPGLPAKSTIIFLDDLVGTGRQSTDYITNKLNQLLSSSHKPYLMCLCATPQGIANVQGNTEFRVLPGLVLKEKTHQFLSDRCALLKNEEKIYLRELNSKIHNPEAGYYGQFGLLLAFYFTVPNNTLPFIWKDKAKYIDADGKEKKWKALLPRNY
jgi:hypothetical protein